MDQLELDPKKKFDFHSGGGKATMAKLDLDPKKKFGFHSGGGRASSTKGTVQCQTSPASSVPPTWRHQGQMPPLRTQDRQA